MVDKLLWPRLEVQADDVAKALGHMDTEGDYITEPNTEDGNEFDIMKAWK